MEPKNSISIEKKINESGITLPETDSFFKIGDLTALRKNPSNKFYRSNYHRGLLLYSLITKYKPKTILEFGTGRGFGALCMARAIVDSNLDSHIYTIDCHSFNKIQLWPIDFGDGPKVIEASIKDIWTKYIPEKWVNKITLLNDSSKLVISNWEKNNLSSPDFVFIDGGHDYQSVKHDYYATLSICSPNFRILFDDYANKPGFGIRKLINEEIEPIFDTELITSQSEFHPIHNINQHQSQTEMIFIDSLQIRQPDQIPNLKINTEKFLHSYRNPNIIIKTIAYLKNCKLLQFTMGPIWRYLKNR